jgi:O-acetyl-ADP-ribose deacetylase (regulator of RNase III)
VKPKACDLTLVQHGMIAHGVNCQGKMGAGLALAIKETYPIAFQYYKELCDPQTDKALLLGTCQIINVTPTCHDQPIFIANCFTQVHYGRTGIYASTLAIEKSLRHALPYAKNWGLPFYMPPIGCGLGGLDWETEVKPVVLHVERDIGWPITIATLDGLTH